MTVAAEAERPFTDTTPASRAAMLRGAQETIGEEYAAISGIHYTTPKMCRNKYNRRRYPGHTIQGIIPHIATLMRAAARSTCGYFLLMAGTRVRLCRPEHKAVSG